MESYFKKKGYQILVKNLRFRCGEVDLLAFDGEKIFLLEVRGRTSRNHLPSRWISLAKLRRLKRLAHIVQLRYKRSVIIELVEVIGVPKGFLTGLFSKPQVRRYRIV